MQETPLCFFNLEWPQPGARIHRYEPVLCGWIVGKEGASFCDVRARFAGKIWSGVLGFPRIDLAAHFKANRPWLPAGFAIALDLPDGPAEITFEACTFSGEWIALQTVGIVVSSEGENRPEHPVRLVGHESRRDPHAPFTGHLEDPAKADVERQTPGGVFGWLKHVGAPIKAVFASTDLNVFNQLDYDLSLQREAPESDIPLSLRFAGHADLLTNGPVCLRIYAQLADDSVHLCFARHTTIALPEEVMECENVSAPKSVAWTDDRTRASDFPSGRPRRLVIGTLNLHACDATLRALDVARHLANSKRWITHLVSTVDGPLRADFEAAGIPVQIVDPKLFYRSRDRREGEAALTQLSREIVWSHRDAAIIFDPLCFWMVQGAVRKKVPVLFDCSEETPLGAYFENRLSSDVRELVVESLQVLRGVCYASATVARRQAGHFEGSLICTVIPHWTRIFTDAPTRVAARAHLGFPPDLRLAVSFNPPAPQHGSSVLLRTFTCKTNDYYLTLPCVFPGSDGFYFSRDVILNKARVLIPPQSNPLFWLTAADVMLNTALSRPSIRPLLDAACAGCPIISTDLPSIRELFLDSDICFIPRGDGPALEKACREITFNDSRLSSARNNVLNNHDARLWLPRYHALLESLL